MVKYVQNINELRRAGKQPQTCVECENRIILTQTGDSVCERSRKNDSSAPVGTGNLFFNQRGAKSGGVRNEGFAGNDGRAWHDIGVFVRTVRHRAFVPAGCRFGNAWLLPVRFAEKKKMKNRF